MSEREREEELTTWRRATTSAAKGQGRARRPGQARQAQQPGSSGTARCRHPRLSLHRAPAITNNLILGFALH